MLFLHPLLQCVVVSELDLVELEMQMHPALGSVEGGVEVGLYNQQCTGFPKKCKTLFCS